MNKLVWFCVFVGKERAGNSSLALGYHDQPEIRVGLGFSFIGLKNRVKFCLVQLT